jgi:mono/diheme cytochrome c family protein
MRTFQRVSGTRRVTLSIATVALSLSACSGSSEGVFGQELYERSCAACHGSQGEGSTARPAIDAGSNAATLSDAQIAGVIRAGPGAMPSFSRLSDAQVESLVEYVRRLQGTTGPDE